MHRFMKAIAAVMLALVVVCTACTKDPENGGNNGGNGSGNGSGGGNSGGGNNGGGTTEGVYLGIIGFNDDLNKKSIGLLDENTEYSYTSFINSLPMRDGTVLYHADNEALDWLQRTTLPQNLFNVSIVTFTDGLDNGSTMLNSNYSAPEDYLNAVHNRIRNDNVGGKSINAYAIGLRGNDVTDNASFQQNLQKLSSSYSNYFEVADWDEAKQRFRQIAIQLYNETTTVNAEVKIPGGKVDGTVIRITFDNVSNANLSQQYIQGTYYREGGKGKLKNVNYQGIQSLSGSEVISDRQEGIFYWYVFADLKLPNGNPLTNTSRMKMWYHLNNVDWQPESEFTPETYSNINVNRKSAVAILVLDCSSSLGSDFANMKDAAVEFVQLLDRYGNSSYDDGGGNNGDGNGGGGFGNGDANGHAYVDLGLPSGTLWATCNVGANVPEDHGDYFAWGEIEPKNDYGWRNYKYCYVSNVVLLTKYCDNSSNGYNGFTDNMISLLLEDDAATANWGEGWRMPTKEEWEELKNNTIYTWTTCNGVDGLLFTAPNGNGLFLPTTGYYTGSSLDNAYDGYYWSSSLESGYPEYSAIFSFSNYFGMGSSCVSFLDRSRGLSVRAVHPASKD